MLHLTRHVGEEIVVGDDITIRVTEIRGGLVRLGIAAPANTTIHRREVYEAIKRHQSSEEEQREGTDALSGDGT